MPAVIAAPMTSSWCVPAGISWAVTCSSGWSAFHASTMALPQATSAVLFDSQISIGPRDSSGPLAAALPARPTPVAVRLMPTTATAAFVERFMVSSWLIPTGRAARIGGLLATNGPPSMGGRRLARGVRPVRSSP